jgi:hypothetical protein
MNFTATVRVAPWPAIVQTAFTPFEVTFVNPAILRDFLEGLQYLEEVGGWHTVNLNGTLYERHDQSFWEALSPPALRAAGVHVGR